jgi:Trk K+ transport system NAD-binding subunit
VYIIPKGSTVIEADDELLVLADEEKLIQNAKKDLVRRG